MNNITKIYKIKQKREIAKTLREQIEKMNK